MCPRSSRPLRICARADAIPRFAPRLARPNGHSAFRPRALACALRSATGSGRAGRTIGSSTEKSNGRGHGARPKFWRAAVASRKDGRHTTTNTPTSAFSGACGAGLNRYSAIDWKVFLRADNAVKDECTARDSDNVGHDLLGADRRSARAPQPHGGSASNPYRCRATSRGGAGRAMGIYRTTISGLAALNYMSAKRLFGSELPAIISALHRHVESEQDRLRLEREAARREDIAEEKAALQPRFRSGADCKWVTIDDTKDLYCRMNGRDYQLVVTPTSGSTCFGTMAPMTPMAG